MYCYLSILNYYLFIPISVYLDTLLLQVYIMRVYAFYCVCNELSSET